jgi:hypothetical protein
MISDRRAPSKSQLKRLLVYRDNHCPLLPIYHDPFLLNYRESEQHDLAQFLFA